MGKLKNGKAVAKHEVTGEMIKGRGDMVMNWVRSLCNMVYERGGVPKDWRSAVIVPLYKNRGLNLRIIEALAC